MKRVGRRLTAFAKHVAVFGGFGLYVLWALNYLFTR